jgi:hypothetical protein
MKNEILRHIDLVGYEVSETLAYEKGKSGKDYIRQLEVNLCVVSGYVNYKVIDRGCKDSYEEHDFGDDLRSAIDKYNSLRD